MSTQAFEHSFDPTATRVIHRRQKYFDLRGATLIVPLLRSVLNDFLQISTAQRRSQRRLEGLDASDRAARLELVNELDRLSNRLEETREELTELGVVILDEVGVHAGLPTIVNGRLAHFVYRNGQSTISHWRYRDGDKPHRVPKSWGADD